MEAATALHEPAPGFLEGVREMCTAEGTVLVFDEMITGFRWSASGAQAVYGVTPDLSTWGKAMGNGFPVSALAGRRELMELGGLRTDADRVFLLSTTHGPETAGLTAFRAVVEAYRREDPVATMRRQGTTLASPRSGEAGDPLHTGDGMITAEVGGQGDDPSRGVWGNRRKNWLSGLTVLPSWCSR